MRQDEYPEHESPPPKGALTLDQWKAAYAELQVAEARLAALRRRQQEEGPPAPSGAPVGQPLDSEAAVIRGQEAEVERLRVKVESMVGDYVASAERARKFASTAGRRQKLRSRWHPQSPTDDPQPGNPGEVAVSDDRSRRGSETPED